MTKNICDICIFCTHQVMRMGCKNGIKFMARKMIFSVFFPPMCECVCVCVCVCVFRDDFLVFLCINVFLSCSMDTWSSGIYEMIDFFLFDLVYKTLVQGRLASYMDTTKGALWSNCGFQIKLRKI